LYVEDKGKGKGPRDPDSISNRLMTYLGDGPPGSDEDNHEGFYLRDALPALNLALTRLRQAIRNQIKEKSIGMMSLRFRPFAQQVFF